MAGIETQQHLGIYRAVDQAVVSGEVDPSTISGLLSPYEPSDVQSTGSAGWFGQVEDLARGSLELDEEAPSPFPDLLDAVRTLGAIEPRSRMRARRLLALAVAMRAFPELLGPDGEHQDLVRAALTVPGLAPDEDAASRLHRLLADPSELPNLEAWPGFIDKLTENELVSHPMALRSQPCKSDIVMMDVGGQLEAVAQYTTSFCTDDVDIVAARAFLLPENWPACTDLWCRMDPIGTAADGTRRFLEVIGPDCENAEGWKMRTCLEVGTADLPGGGAVMSYRKCPDPAASDGQVTVDEGSVTIVPNAQGGVCVTTTKRLRFSMPFDGGGLALVLCTFGWGTLAEDLVLGCAYDGANPAAPWPGSTGPASGKPPAPIDFMTGTGTGTGTGSGTGAGTGSGMTTATSPTAKSGGAGTGAGTATKPGGKVTGTSGEGLKAVVDDAGEALKDCLDKCIEAGTTAMSKVLDGTYDVNDGMSYMTSSMQRAVDDLATAMSLSVRAAQAAPRKRSS